jgi:hypothetical protein
MEIFVSCPRLGNIAPAESRVRYCDGSEQAGKSIFRNFLLGKLDPAEQRVLEQCFPLCEALSDEDVRAAEAELIEDYVEGGLSTEDKDRFETHFLCTLERRQSFQLIQALRHHIDKTHSCGN